jgi:thiamine transport system ATP-binding protein
VLTVEQITVRYEEHTALDGIDLAVADGEIVAVLGPSGTGKTTLLRAIAGLEAPTDGRVLWDGADLAGVPPHRRQFGLMFQDHALFPHRDVLANVAFGLRMQRRSRAEIDTRARDALTAVALPGFEHRAINTLSGGEQQRVALARALAPAPRLLMLDEPLGSLDRELRERLADELRTVLTGLGVTALFVTHDHDEAFAVADRVAIMRAGTIEQSGPATDVWQRPATEFAARFLGYNVTAAFGTGLVAVRPEGLHVAATGSVTGTVTARTFRRDHFRVRVDVGDAAPLDVAVGAADLPEIGTTVHVEPDSFARFVPLQGHESRKQAGDDELSPRDRGRARGS